MHTRLQLHCTDTEQLCCLLDWSQFMVTTEHLLTPDPSERQSSTDGCLITTVFFLLITNQTQNIRILLAPGAEPDLADTGDSYNERGPPPSALVVSNT